MVHCVFILTIPCLVVGRWSGLAGALRSVWYQRRGEEAVRAGPPDETQPSEPKLHQGDSSWRLGPSDPQPMGLQPEESHELARRGMAGRARKYWYIGTLFHNGVIVITRPECSVIHAFYVHPRYVEVA